jgi:hypothetical protein
LDISSHYFIRLMAHLVKSTPTGASVLLKHTSQSLCHTKLRTSATPTRLGLLA